MNMIRFKISLLGIAFLLIMTSMVMIPAAAHGGPHYTCGPHDFGTCPEGQECQCNGEQICEWGDWNNGRCPGPTGEACQEYRAGPHWYHRHYECHMEQDCGCAQPECTNGMGFRVSIPSSPDPTPYNIGPAPATVDFWSNPYPNIEDLFPVGTTYLWNFGDGTTSTDGPGMVYHTYTTPGIYDVTLTVTFPEGCSDVVSETKEKYLLVTASEGQSGSMPNYYTMSIWGEHRDCYQNIREPITIQTDYRGSIPVYVEWTYMYPFDGTRSCSYPDDDLYCNPRGNGRAYFKADPVSDAITNTGGILINNLGMVSRKIHILGCKDETSTPEGADLSVQVVNALNGDIIYSESTTGDQMCIHEVIGLKDRLTGCVPNNAWEKGWPDIQEMI